MPDMVTFQLSFTETSLGINSGLGTKKQPEVGVYTQKKKLKWGTPKQSLIQ